MVKVTEAGWADKGKSLEVGRGNGKQVKGDIPQWSDGVVFISLYTATEPRYHQYAVIHSQPAYAGTHCAQPRRDGQAELT